MATTDSKRRLIKISDLPSDATLNAALYNDVKTYGAVGDGSNDDTSAIQAALDDSTPYGVTAFPAGTYKITSTLTMSVRGQQMVGSGTAGAGTTGGNISTILKAGNFHAITVAHGEQVIRNLHIKGDAGNGGDGITVEQIKVCIQNVICNAHGGNGIMIGRNSNNANYWTMYNVSCSSNGAVGLYIHDDGGAAPDTNAGSAFGCHFTGNTSHGLHIENSIDNQFFGLACDSNTGDGIHLSSGAKGHSFWFPYLEANGGTDGLIDSGALQNFIFGARQGTSDGWTDNDGTNDNIIMGRDNSFNDRYIIKGNISFNRLWSDGDVIFGKATGTDNHKLTINSNSGGVSDGLVLDNNSATVASRGTQISWQNEDNEVGSITVLGDGSASADGIMLFKTALASSLATGLNIDKNRNVAIGKGGTAAAADAVLEVSSTTQGLLLPRMTTGQRDAISSPTDGLVIYNSSTNKINVRANSGWEAVTSA